jgi:hypothetical protein
MGTGERHVFVSYSRADAAWLERLRVHLRPVARQHAVDFWDDSRISPGQDWREEIVKALAAARVAILLVSADFLASDFIVDNELPPLLHRASRGGVLVLPVIVGPCLWSEHGELSRYQSVNRPDRPLSSMAANDADATLVSLSRSVAQYFRLLDIPPAVTEVAKPPGGPERSTPQPASPEPDANVSPSPLVVDRPVNLGFDGFAPDGIPVGWFNGFGHVSGVSTDYRIRLTHRSDDRTAGTCVVLEKSAAAPEEFGSLMQRCAGRFLAGRTVRLEGDLRAENVSGWAGLWLRADNEAVPNLFFDNMSRRPVIGTTDWQRYSIDAPLPRETDWLNYGIVLAGSGVLYADNLRVLCWSQGRWEEV